MNRNINSLCKAHGVQTNLTALALRHSAAQSLADAGHSRDSIQSFLGHASKHTAQHYIEASPNQADAINTALGASKLYGKLVALANRDFVTLEDIELAEEDKQVGAVVGERLVWTPHMPFTSDVLVGTCNHYLNG
ncbi:tyrosine-type recombinase/integrase [Paraburkholderia aspalathi]|uniref:tyrosine-type recombinase/integrase n=1 Tax=Paraburkholderia aspalathi TaxID=1324617 RepID=UPI00142DAF1A|nr:tyrosine-type recombinase/integrase [Paraburkholderia aspalathi]